MSLDANSMRKKAATLIRSNGQGTSTFYVPTTAGTYDPDTGVVTGEVIEEIVLSTTPPLPYAATMKGGDSPRVGTGQMFVGAEGLTFQPYVGQKLLHNGLTWTVLTVSLWAIGSTPIAYELGLERGSQ